MCSDNGDCNSRKIVLVPPSAGSIIVDPSGKSYPIPFTESRICPKTATLAKGSLFTTVLSVFCLHDGSARAPILDGVLP